MGESIYSQRGQLARLELSRDRWNKISTAAFEFEPSKVKRRYTIDRLSIHRQTDAKNFHLKSIDRLIFFPHAIHLIAVVATCTYIALILWQQSSQKKVLRSVMPITALCQEYLLSSSRYKFYHSFSKFQYEIHHQCILTQLGTGRSSIYPNQIEERMRQGNKGVSPAIFSLKWIITRRSMANN